MSPLSPLSLQHKSMSSHPPTPYTPILPSDFSYFSPLAPESASLPPSASSSHHSQSYTYTASSSSQASSSSSSSSSGGEAYPVITATITSRSPPPPPPQEMLAQFSLHFPSPPSLRLPPSSSPHPASQHASQPTPKISPTVPPAHSLPSPMDRSRRTGSTPVMTAQTGAGKHTLSVLLPKSIAPEMVTVSANKGDRLKVVADAWHMEDDCHYEWMISFQPYDVDMSSVHARFDPDGRLTIDVNRRMRFNGVGMPGGGGYFARA